MDVNKIHFILASVQDPQQIIDTINKQLERYKNEFNLRSFTYYYNKLANSNRYDTKEIIFIKRLLQKELPVKLRKKMTEHLFHKYVTNDEESFARELYMNVDQVKCMIQNEMYFGGHGYDHLWMDQLTAANQKNEIDRTISFLREIGSPTNQWIMCYPYGAYSEQLITLLKKKNCTIGLTTKSGTCKFN